MLWVEYIPLGIEVFNYGFLQSLAVFSEAQPVHLFDSERSLRVQRNDEFAGLLRFLRISWRLFEDKRSGSTGLWLSVVYINALYLSHGCPAVAFYRIAMGIDLCLGCTSENTGKHAPPLFILETRLKKIRRAATGAVKKHLETHQFLTAYHKKKTDLMRNER